MRKFILALAVLIGGAFPAFAYDTPAELVKDLYAPYFQSDFDWGSFDETKFRSKELNALFDKDAKEADGEVGRIDFDPYVDGQDYDLTNLEIGKATIKGETATIEVTFKNMDMEEDMVFALVKEADGWKIDDVNSKGGADPYSLKAILEAPLESD